MIHNPKICQVNHLPVHQTQIQKHHLFYQIIQAQIMTHFVMLDRVQQNEDSIIINKLRHALD